MKLKNKTLGELERLTLLNCPVVIRGGEAHAPLWGLVLAAPLSLLHKIRVIRLRNRMRKLRAQSVDHALATDNLEVDIMTVNYEARQALPSRWFNRS